MDKALAILVLLANLLALKCQEEDLIDNEEHVTSTGNPNYSFSYGVSDANTGDVKAVWEEKEGDTVKGHYSVLEADGSTRTVEYSASPSTGFTAVVNNDGEKVEQHREARNSIEDKALREYGKFEDFSEDDDFESYINRDRKKSKHPFDTVFKDYSAKKRPKYPLDLESSDFSHSITIKHPRDEFGPDSESHSHSHFGLNLDPNCKTKHKKVPYGSIDFELSKHQDFKYPLFSPASYKDNFEKYEPSNDYEKVVSPYNFGAKYPKLPSDLSEYEKFNAFWKEGTEGKIPKFEDFRPSRYPFIPDMPSSDYYPEDLPQRPKKKRKPRPRPESHYPSEDLDDYILVPKKKKKTPPRFVEPNDYLPDDEEYDRPRYPDEDEDDRPHKEPPRGTGPKKEVIRKIIKKRRPGFNLLDILDI